MDSNLLRDAELGDADAQFEVGLNYLGEDNNSEAFSWFLKAAEQDHPGALGMCGEMLMNGTGVAQDFNNAAVYFMKGAQLGDTHSQYRIGWVYWNDSNYEEANTYLQQASDGGNAAAKCLLGKSYFNGNGVYEDKERALELFEEAAYLGDAEAQYLAGTCYGFGYGTNMDIDRAVYYCQQAAAQGHEDATKNLEIFRKGQEDPELFRQQVMDAQKPAQPEPQPQPQTNFANNYTPPQTSYQPSYSSSSSGKKPGSWGMAILLILVFFPIGIWYIFTHEM